MCPSAQASALSFQSGWAAFSSLLLFVKLTRPSKVWSTVIIRWAVGGTPSGPQGLSRAEDIPWTSLETVACGVPDCLHGGKAGSTNEPCEVSVLLIECVMPH